MIIVRADVTYFTVSGRKTSISIEAVEATCDTDNYVGQCISKTKIMSPKCKADGLSNIFMT